MSDDFLTLKMLVVSEAATEREIVRRVAAEVSLPIELTEAEDVRDSAAADELLARAPYDIVLFDSRMPKSNRQVLLDAIRKAKSRPLAILVGAAEMKTREVLTDGLEVDGALAKPIDTEEAHRLIENCCRARLPRRVLIVDDSSTIRSIIRKVFQASRYRLEAEEADEGATAIAWAKKQRFDIVFLDCHMPGIDGFATLEHFRRSQPDTKVVMITGTRDFRIEDRAHAEGAKDFLYKPFFAKDIDAVLNRLFGLMRPRWN
jgi:CheY-like chemotaxis protein